MKITALSAIMAAAFAQDEELKEEFQGSNIERFFKVITHEQMKESFDDGSVSKCPLEGFCLPKDGTPTTCGTVTLLETGRVAVTKTVFDNVCIWADACDASVDIEDGEF